MSDEEWIDVSTIGSPYEQQVMIGGIGTRWRHRRRVFSMDFMMTGRDPERPQKPRGKTDLLRSSERSLNDHSQNPNALAGSVSV